MTKLQINITKEIIERAKFCNDDPQQNCAIALAIRDIFPEGAVSSEYIRPYGLRNHHYINLPHEAKMFIIEFDSKRSYEREKMEPISFTIEIPDSILDQIDIEEIRTALAEHLLFAYYDPAYFPRLVK